MIRALSGLCLLAVATMASAEPWFCHGINCPPYRSVCNSSSYEIRSYPLSKWSATNEDGASISANQETGFQRLFDYISGKNSANVKIEMTSPVLQTVSAELNATHFYLPYKYQSMDLPSIPQPTAKDTYLFALPAITVAVRSFGGFATDSEYYQNAAMLHSDLASAGVEVDQSSFFTAGYDPPFRLLGRHNEVWYAVKSDPAKAC